MYKYRLEHSLSQLLVCSSGEAAKKSFLALVYLLYINIYIKYIMYYIYVCVCLCVCVWGGVNYKQWGGYFRSSQFCKYSTS